MKSKEEIEKLINRLATQNIELAADQYQQGEWVNIQIYCNNAAINYLKWVIE